MASDNDHKIDRKRLLASVALREANNDQWKAVGLLLCMEEGSTLDFEEAFFLIFYPDWPNQDQ